MPDPQFVELDGHKVDPRTLDRFFNHDGSRVSDEQWDESKQRYAIAEERGVLPPTLEIRTTPPEDD